MDKLTDRQKREISFFNKWSQTNKIDKVSFDVISTEERPWNPYWFLCKYVLGSFKHSGQRLLDFGCGQGYYLVIFAKIGYEVYGFDISEEAISNAAILAEKYNYKDKIKFSVQIAESLTYPAGFFDIITGIDILHHVDVDKSMREAFRVLKVGGKAIFIEWFNVSVLERIRESSLGRWLVPKNISLERCCTEDEKKLTNKDIQNIRNIFPSVSIKRFRFLNRLSPIIKHQSLLERIDYFIFKIFPFLEYLGGQVVITVKK